MSLVEEIYEYSRRTNEWWKKKESSPRTVKPAPKLGKLKLSAIKKAVASVKHGKR